MKTTAMPPAQRDSASVGNGQPVGHELWRLLGEAQAAFSDSGRLRVSPQRVFELLENASQQTATHFALEEAFGYFVEAISLAPWLAGRAETLCAQHTPLFQSICDIADQAKRLLSSRGSKNVAAIRSRLNRFYQELQEHESNETDMMMQAYYEDLGVGD